MNCEREIKNILSSHIKTWLVNEIASERSAVQSLLWLQGNVKTLVDAMHEDLKNNKLIHTYKSMGDCI